MTELGLNVLGGFLAALVFAAVGAAWTRLISPSYVSNDASLWPSWLKRLVPDSDSVVLIPLHKRAEYEAKGFRPLKRWRLSEVRTESAHGDDQFYLRRPKAG